MGENPAADDFRRREQQASAWLERRFWNPELKYYHYGLASAGRLVSSLNPMIGFSAWFGSLPEDRARLVLERLATAAFLADWGQRNRSLEDARYQEGSYIAGSVWPFMTAGPMLGQFRYGHAVQAFRSWMSMISLRLLSARGGMPEVLSGSFYRPLESGVPHQMFAELAIIPGLARATALWKDQTLEAVVEGWPGHRYRGRLLTQHAPVQTTGCRVLERKPDGAMIGLTAPEQGGTDRSGYTRWVVRIRIRT
jgi:hypothetical protein